MSARPRYRVENGAPCVDVRASALDRLFDNRDPAPFRERDLDPSLVEYLRDASEDLASQPRLHVVFWMKEPCTTDTIEAAVRAHFAHEVHRLVRARHRQRRAGLVALAIASVAMLVLTSLAPVVASAIHGAVGTALSESLVVASWVLMWRPIEVLVFDWIPSSRDRFFMQKVLDAAIDVRQGDGPPP